MLQQQVCSFDSLDLNERNERLKMATQINHPLILAYQLYKSINMKDLSKQLQLKKIDEGLLFSRTNKLGQGVFGEVYVGFDETSRLPFAVKVVNLEKIITQENQETLMRKIKDEIINMQIAKNQHIVQFQQAKSSSRNIYILCEYCNGSNLDEFIRKRSYLTELEAHTFFSQILKGFYKLRERNIVHRDIKPANLLLHNYKIKIADLGFSKSTEGHEQLLESVVGSPMYMSPQIFEREKYTEKTDIWSLGVIFFEMLYGASPWTGCHNIGALKEKIRKQIKFPAYPYVSASTKDLITRMLAVQQQDRIGWQVLFQQYLNPNSPLGPQAAHPFHYALNLVFFRYFSKSYNIESQFHLHTVVENINVLPYEELTKLGRSYSNSEDFFAEVKFINSNKQLIEEYYHHYLEKRNEISYLMVMMEKLNLYLLQTEQPELQGYLYAIHLLIFKFGLTQLDEMVNQDGLILREKYSHLAPIRGKFFHDRLLYVLFQNDKKKIKEEYGRFFQIFTAFLTEISKSYPSIFNQIRSELSGIYSSQQGDLRVIRFFLGNYLKRLFNGVREQTIRKKQADKKRKQSRMEEQQEEEEDIDIEETVKNPLDFMVLTMTNEYLQNSRLFDLKIQQQNQKNPKGAVFKRNLNQFLFDCQTTMQPNFYEKLQYSKTFQEESVISFLSKQINWTPLLTPRPF